MSTQGPTPGLPAELLADLHAGVLDEAAAAAVRRQVAADPRAREVLRALDATVAELRALPTPALPGDVAARLDAALAAEAAARPSAAVVPLHRRAAWGGVALLAAAAVAVAVALGSGPPETPGAPVAAPLRLTAGDLADGLDDALGVADYGPLTDPAVLRGCLAANGAAGAPLGAREVTVGGRRGVLLVLPTGRLARFRLLVVGPDCTAGTPSVLADEVVG